VSRWGFLCWRIYGEEELQTLRRRVSEKENRAGILLCKTSEDSVEETPKTTPQGYPHGEALLTALFIQVNQRPVNHPLPPILRLLFERRSSLTGTSQILSTLPLPKARSAGCGSPAIVRESGSLVMTATGASMLPTYSSRTGKSAPLLPGGQPPRHCADRSLLSAAMSQSEIGTTRFSR
jgi:hypothetical protein